MKNALLSLILIACTAAAVEAEQVGEIIFVDGEVELLRGEETLTGPKLSIGGPIDNLDRIRTGQDGQVTIAITASHAAASEISVASGTAFYVEVDRIERRSTTTLGLMTGSMALKVQRLSGNRDIAVRTETTAMGVRGTTFQVTTSPAGDVLVSTNEGSVVCSDDEKGTEFVAEPGQVVERRIDEASFAAIPVAVSILQEFQREWIAGRMEVFRSNALKVTRSFALRYDRLVGEFNDTYDELMGNTAVLAKWVREERSGTVGSSMEMMREKRAVVGDLLRLRKTLFVLERVYFRLAELERYYNEGFGRGDLRPGLSAAQFWRRFAADRRDLAAKMGRVRTVVRMYAKRNDGQLPVEF